MIKPKINEACVGYKRAFFVDKVKTRINKLTIYKTRVKTKVNKVAHEKATDLIMMERLLEGVSLSRYRDNFILKGGFLMVSIVGLDTRATIDLDVTIEGELVNSENIKMMAGEIIQISIDDDIIFEFKNISEICEADDYERHRVHLIGNFPPMAVPLKLDVTTGDKITPKEIQYQHQTMFDGKHIPIGGIYRMP